MSAPRKTLSKRARFEVFKRDGFTCQYCGRKPPDVTLQCDHIKPVAGGGSDDPLNLITACFDCNSGKSAVPLGDCQPPVDAEAMRLETEQQLAEVRLYQAAVDELEAETDAAINELGRMWMEEFRTTFAPYQDIAKWVTHYGAPETYEAISIAAGSKVGEYYPGVNASRKRYIGGILRNRKNASDGRVCSTCRSHFGEGRDTACMRRPAGDDEYYVVHPQNSCAEWSS